MPTVQTNDIETYYEQRGEGPVAVFVHAALVDHSMWAPQLDALGDEYTAIVYDVRGHGRTGGSAVESYSIDLFVQDLEAFLAALDLERPVLCGGSTGGTIAQAYAARHPDRIAGLVLADSWTTEILDWRDRLTLAWPKAAIPQVRLFGFERVQRVMAWIHERFNKGASGEYGTIVQLQAEMPSIPFDEFAKIARSISSAPETYINLRSITAPTLVLYGENTMGLVRRHSAKMDVDIPKTSVKVVPDGGHACNLDNPEFFTAALREFLTGLVYSDVAEGVDELVSVEKSN